jgi:3-oxoacyl-[acyl-carrier protein] reductase
VSAAQEFRTAVVTGGGTGIGRAVATLLAADGYRVAVLGRRREVLDEVAGEIGGVAVTADLALPSDVARAAEEVAEALGTVDALVLNAGSARRGPQETLEQLAAHWTATMAQNLLPAVLLEHALRDHLRRPGGRVVAVSSSSARVVGGEVAYAASKAALNRWVRTMAAELGREGITVNAVAPGFVPDTGLYDGTLDPDWTERAARSIAVRRVGTPADIADSIRWLVSPGAGFVNGTVVEVDGGRRV